MKVRVKTSSTVDLLLLSSKCSLLKGLNSFDINRVFFSPAFGSVRTILGTLYKTINLYLRLYFISNSAVPAMPCQYLFIFMVPNRVR